MDGHLPTVTLPGGGDRGSRWGLPDDSTDPVHEDSTLTPDHLQTPPHWRSGFNTRISGDTQSPSPRCLWVPPSAFLVLPLRCPFSVPLTLQDPALTLSFPTAQRGMVADRACRFRTTEAGHPGKSRAQIPIGSLGIFALKVPWPSFLQDPCLHSSMLCVSVSALLPLAPAPAPRACYFSCAEQCSSPLSLRHPEPAPPRTLPSLPRSYRVIC